MVTDAAYYQRILDLLYDGLVALSTVGYQWSADDRWTRGRFVDIATGATRHLATWIDLGEQDEYARSHVRHRSSMIIACRYGEEQDAVAQGRMHGAARAAQTFLLGAHGPTIERATPTGYTLAGLSDSFSAVDLTFDLYLPRES